MVTNPLSLTTVAHSATSSTFPSPTFWASLLKPSLLFPTPCGEILNQDCSLTWDSRGVSRGFQTGNLSVSFLPLSNCIKYTLFLLGALLNEFYSNDCTLAPVNRIILLFISMSCLSCLLTSPACVLAGRGNFTQPHTWAVPTLM